MIPETWKLHFIRENMEWVGSASKYEGFREISVNTYNDGKLKFDQCYELLEERIKL
jgi:hypothetical protein